MCNEAITEFKRVEKIEMKLNFINNIIDVNNDKIDVSKYTRSKNEK